MIDGAHETPITKREQEIENMKRKLPRIFTVLISRPPRSRFSTDDFA
jgi:hypothetical protein